MKYTPSCLLIAAVVPLTACQVSISGLDQWIAAPQITVENVRDYHQFDQWLLLNSQNEPLCSSEQVDCTELPPSDDGSLKLFWQRDNQIALHEFSNQAALPGRIEVQWQVDDLAFTDWYQDLPAAYSIQFDDWCGHSSFGIYEHAFPIFQARGLVGSIGIIAGQCYPEEWQQAQEMVDAGWSVFNHSMTHGYPIAPSWDPDAVVNWDNDFEISQSNDLIAENLNGYRPEIIALPNDLLTTEIDQYVRNHPDFIGMRGPNEMDGSWLSSSGMNYRSRVKPCPMGAVCDSIYEPLDTYFLRNDLYGPFSGFKYFGTSSLIAMVDFPINYGGWALQYNHGVEDASWETIPLDVFVEFADYLQQKKQAQEIWVAKPETVVRYHHATLECEVEQVQALPYASKVAIKQSDACLRHNTDITLALPSNMNIEQVWQGDSRLEVYQKADRTLVDFQPGAGDLLVIH